MHAHWPIKLCVCIPIILKYRGKTFYLYMIYVQSTNIAYFSVNFLDKRSEQMGKSVLQRCNDSKPVILLMDNINMYRGRKRHDRLFTEVGPKMWNFTGCAAIIPDLTDVEDLLTRKETTTCPQIDMSSLTVEDILLGGKTNSYVYLVKIW